MAAAAKLPSGAVHSEFKCLLSEKPLPKHAKLGCLGRRRSAPKGVETSLPWSEVRIKIPGLILDH